MGATSVMRALQQEPEELKLVLSVDVSQLPGVSVIANGNPQAKIASPPEVSPPTKLKEAANRGVNELLVVSAKGFQSGRKITISAEGKEPDTLSVINAFRKLGDQPPDGDP